MEAGGMIRRYLAIVEHDDSVGTYHLSYPGIEKMGSRAKRPEDIVPVARRFLDSLWRDLLPPSLDDAITDPSEPFEGVKLVVFDYEPPPPRTRYRIVGYDGDEAVLAFLVSAEQIGHAIQALGQHSSHVLSREEARDFGVTVPAGFSYVLEAETESAA
jgi:hypothetical protein